MRTPSPALAPYLRSDAQARILALLLLQRGRQYTLADISRETGVLPAVVHREVSRLVDGGVLADVRNGRNRLVRADGDYRLLKPLTTILAATYGPVPVLTSLLRDVPGVKSAYIFGSWAARHRGEPGPPPNDVDVLVVGEASRMRLNDIAGEAEQQLGVPVTITRLAPDVWTSGSEPFVRTVRQRQLVELEVQQ